jgi:hypothetical protein|tara:strand:+ start:1360 stop:1782 length:423 start_codon:yes stop_codon:yes gene_type:complete
VALLDELQESWAKDCLFDELALGDESLVIPRLHQKYHVYYNKYKLILEEKKIELGIIRKQKWLYYNGKGPNTKGEYFDLKVLKGDLNIFLDSDEDIAKQTLTIKYFETCINYIENILKMINNRGFQVKNAIDAKRYEFPV